MFLHQVFKDMYNSFLIIFEGLVVSSLWLTNFFPKLKKEGLDSIHELNDVRTAVENFFLQ